MSHCFSEGQFGRGYLRSGPGGVKYAHSERNNYSVELEEDIGGAIEEAKQVHRGQTQRGLLASPYKRWSVSDVCELREGHENYGNSERAA